MSKRRPSLLTILIEFLLFATAMLLLLAWQHDSDQPDTSKLNPTPISPIPTATEVVIILDPFPATEKAPTPIDTAVPFVGIVAPEIQSMDCSTVSYKAQADSSDLTKVTLEGNAEFFTAHINSEGVEFRVEITSGRILHYRILPGTQSGSDQLVPARGYWEGLRGKNLYLILSNGEYIFLYVPWPETGFDNNIPLVKLGRSLQDGCN